MALRITMVLNACQRRPMSPLGDQVGMLTPEEDLIVQRRTQDRGKRKLKRSLTVFSSVGAIRSSCVIILNHTLS